jgi:hypothetical protein
MVYNEAYGVLQSKNTEVSNDLLRLHEQLAF